jgi:hypothetical protein
MAARFSVTDLTVTSHRRSYGAGNSSIPWSLAMSEQRPSASQEREPSLGMSVGVLCLILFGLFAIVANISVPDIRLAPAAMSVEL